MILLLGIIFAFIVAFLAIAIVLNIRLISSPFRLRLRSFIRVVLRIFIIVRTRLTLYSIDLYLL
jgi:hypothetical protein